MDTSANSPLFTMVKNIADVRPLEVMIPGADIVLITKEKCTMATGITANMIDHFNFYISLTFCVQYTYILNIYNSFHILK